MSCRIENSYCKGILLKQFLLLLFFIPFFVTSQTQDTIRFNLKVGEKPLVLHQNYYSEKDTFRLETVCFYVSNVRLLKEGKTVSNAEGMCFLVDAEYDSSLVMLIPVSKNNRFDEIVFDMGIDSTLNVAGVQGGVLDPVTGMYWSWQSGYINAKIEGWSPKSSARKQEFQYHLGGYLSPFEARRTMHFKRTETTSALSIDVQLDNFLRQVDLTNKPMVMSPGAVAAGLSDHLSTCFSVEQ